MPRLIDYPAVEQQMAAQGLVSLYPNSGAFGHPKGTATHTVGWVAGEDPTIRPAARPLTVAVPPPAGPVLARLAADAWRELLSPGPAWVLPKAHWAYELDFGSGAWMPGLLRGVGLDADALAARHDGTAAEFAAGESAGFVALVAGLLANLLGSDFQLAFPGRDVVCTVHHHQQLWWTSPDAGLVAALRAMAVPGPAAAG